MPKKIITTRLDKLSQKKFFYVDQDDEKKLPYLDLENRENLGKMAEQLGLTKEAVTAIDDAFDYMRDAIIEAANQEIADLFGMIEEL
jgi:hypothetical protein